LLLRAVSSVDHRTQFESPILPIRCEPSAVDSVRKWPGAEWQVLSV
jgi:hypothetical protein